MTKVFGPVAIFDVCGHIVSDEQLDGRLLNSAYAVYRQRHGLLTPEKIWRIPESERFSDQGRCRS